MCFTEGTLITRIYSMGSHHYLRAEQGTGLNVIYRLRDINCKGKQEKWDEREEGSWGKRKQLHKAPNWWLFSCLLIIST